MNFFKINFKSKFIFLLLITIILASCKKEITIKEVVFDDIKPGYTELKQCWCALGIDKNETVYIGWTSKRIDRREDFTVFSYNNNTNERKFLGTFIDTSKKYNNIEEGEEIPKGHTYIVNIGDKMYMGSQGFHDFKGEIYDLPKYRGSHLYSYDIKTQEMEDISRFSPNGVITKNQGIVAIAHVPQTSLLACLTHPLCDIVLFDTENNKIEKYIKGIPWKKYNPLSRDIVAADNGKIYIYRGTEDPIRRNQVHNMWSYDLKTEKLTETENQLTGGFWCGQTKTKDGKTIYLSTVNGELYKLDVETEKLTHLGPFLPKEIYNNSGRIKYLYGITLSYNEKKIYGIPCTFGNLYEYDIAKKEVKFVKHLGEAIYTGSDIRDSKGNIYVARFAMWQGNCKLLAIHVGETK